MLPVKLLFMGLGLAVAGATHNPLAYLIAMAMTILFWWPQTALR